MHKHKKRKAPEPFQEVSRTAPIVKESTKIKHSRDTSDTSVALDEYLIGEKKAATRILDQLLGGGSSSSAPAEKDSKSSAAPKKRKEVAVSSNWEKIRAHLPPSSNKKLLKPFIPAAPAAPPAAAAMPTTVTFNSASEETRYI